MATKQKQEGLGLLAQLMQGLGLAEQPQRPQHDAHMRDYQGDQSQRARDVAKFLSDLIQMKDRGTPQNAGEARYNNMMFYPPIEALRGLGLAGNNPMNRTYNEQFGNKVLNTLGTPLEYPFYSGSKFIVPPSAGLPQSQDIYRGKLRETPLGSAYSKLQPSDATNDDRFAQEVYGNLVVMGHPVYGPSYKEVYGEPGIIGFGRK